MWAALALVICPGARTRGRTALSAPRRRERGRAARVVGAAGALGLACVAVGGPVGGGIAAAGLCPPVAWLAARTGRAAAAPPDPALPLMLDLAAAALRSGRTLPDALDAALPAVGEQLGATVRQVSGLLRLGADPAAAWAAVPAGSPLATVAAAAVRSASSGLRVALTLERLAGELRAAEASQAAARAQRAGVSVLAPLGACFLPAFVCLGIVPVVAGLAASSFGGLR